MRKFLLSLMLLCACSGLMAQKTITGNVSDSGGGLPGASITIKNSNPTIGTVTADDGSFSISAKEGDVLVISFMGYEEKEVKVSSKTNMKISMEEDTEVLKEVVIDAGYGKMRKSDVTGSTSQLSGDAVKAVSTVSAEQALSGRVSGVQVSSGSGQPGAESSVRIRGTSSLTGNNEPLYVVDGMPIGGGRQSTGSNPLASINPADIVSMEILKDASATAIYGSRAASGVIMITTKRGAIDQPARIAYSGQFSVSKVSDKLDLMDLHEYASYYSDKNVYTAFSETGADPELLAATRYGKGTDWQDEIFQTALSHSHQLSVTGGSKETQYAFSLGYMDQEGVMVNTEFERYNGRMNLENQTKKWLRTGVSLAYTHINQMKQAGFEQTDDNKLSGLGSNSGEVDETIYTQMLISKPTTAAKNFDGSYAELGSESEAIKSNPARSANYSPIYITKNNVIGSVFANIEFIKNLNWRNEFGIDYTNAQENQFTPENGESANSQVFIYRNNYYWRYCSTLSYLKDFGAKKNHHLNAMAGFEAWEASWSGSDITKNNLLDDELFIDPDYQNTNLGEDGQITGYKGAQSMLSFLARLNYNYADRYLATVTGRFDGSSTLSPENRWGFFPSFSLAWRIDQESFYKDSDFKRAVNSMKLRAGYGQTGNSGSNMGYISYNSQRNGNASTNGTGMVNGTWLNEDLIWETNWQVNVGLDLGFLRGDRITAVIDAYYKQNNDLIVEADPGATLASSDFSYTNLPDINAGSIKNVGLDLSITSQNIKKRIANQEFSWVTDLNFSLVRNEVLELQRESSVLKGEAYFKSATRTYCISRVGDAPGVFYGYKTDGIIQNTAQLNSLERFSGTSVGDINYVDINGDGVINDNDKTIIGDPNPDFTFGFNNTFSWGPWSLSIALAGTYGNDVYNLLRSRLEGQDKAGINQLSTVLDYARVKTNEDGTQEVINSNTNMPIPASAASSKDDANTVSDRYVEDASFVRIQNAGIAYTLPQKYTEQMHLSNLRLSFNVQNIYTFTNYSGLNPEVTSSTALCQGIDYGSYPLPRMFVVGLNFDF